MILVDNFIRKYRRYSTPESYTPDDGIVYWREKLILSVIFVMVRLAAVAYIPSLILAVNSGLWVIAAIDTIAYAVVIYLYLNKSLSSKIKSLILLIILFVLSVFLLFIVGALGAGYLWLFFLPIVAAVFLNQNYAYSLLILNIITLFVFGILRQTQIYNPESLGPFAMESWIIITANFVALNVFTVFTFLLLINGLTRTIVNERKTLEKLKERTKELVIAKRNAEKADSLKSDFLAQMSHEIRTPINTILSFISLLEQDIAENRLDEVDEYFRSIEKGSRRVIRTIDLILNMSEFQTGTYEVNPEKLDLKKDIIDVLYLEFKLIAKNQNVSLNLITGADEKLPVHVDSYTTTQIFSNLLDNAIKYSPGGDVQLVINNYDQFIIVDIIDNGVGISEEYQKNLFTPFSQEESGYTRKFEGTGLGLALVKNYCEVNGAEISVDSKKGEGTKFTVKFRRDS